MWPQSTSTLSCSTGSHNFGASPAPTASIGSSGLGGFGTSPTAGGFPPSLSTPASSVGSAAFPSLHAPTSSRYTGFPGFPTPGFPGFGTPPAPTSSRSSRIYTLDDMRKMVYDNAPVPPESNIDKILFALRFSLDLPGSTLYYMNNFGRFDKINLNAYPPKSEKTQSKEVTEAMAKPEVLDKTESKEKTEKNDSISTLKNISSKSDENASASDEDIESTIMLSDEEIKSKLLSSDLTPYQLKLVNMLFYKLETREPLVKLVHEMNKKYVEIGKSLKKH